MSIHDWTRVSAGRWHAFHVRWINALCDTLNDGGLTGGYYADPDRDMSTRTPKRTLAVRSEEGDRLAAIVELVSPGNKTSRREIEAAVSKVTTCLSSGVHVGLVDLVPVGGTLLPDGLTAAVADACGFARVEVLAERPLAVASFEAADRDGPTRLFAEPLAVGDDLPDLPLFLRPGVYVDVPLAPTYATALAATPSRWRGLLDA